MDTITSEKAKQVLVPAVAGVVGFVAGSVSTLFYVRHRMRKELAYFDEVIGAYEQAEDEEYTEDDDGYDDIRAAFVEEDGYVVNPRMDPSTIRLGAPMTKEEIHGTEEEAVEEDPEIYNVFAASNEGWDWEVESAERTTIKPYILHQEEYFNDEKGYDQTTLTYYEGDETLCDDQQLPIPNLKSILGAKNLQWGHGTANQDCVYIRNDRLKAEYEVLRDPGMYAVEVLGNDVEDAYAEADLKHSKHQNMRFFQE
ncbi:hypothetical protein KC887_02335 [Candidatus Kaiserbacteria bacterium]|nr:hypothetical protein [Candidatus Kaiserbacteria bacterium]